MHSPEPELLSSSRPYFALLLLLTGCVTSDMKAEAFSLAVNHYGRCMFERGTEVASQPEDPYYLMLSAKSYCGDARLKAIDTIEGAYPISQWPQQIAILDSRVEEATVARIINARRDS